MLSVNMTTSTNETLVHIREAYWSAGDKFKWNNRWSRAGVGIAIPSFRGDGYITMKLDNPEGIYRIEKMEARNIVKRWNSVMTQKGVRLGVLPLDAFDEVPPCGHPENHNNGEETCQECEVIKHNV
jgi:hypothetical protein